MATMSKSQRIKPSPGSHRLVLLLTVFAFILLLSSVISTGKLSLPYQQTLIDYFATSPRGKRQHTLSDKYLYWGNRIDCPGKNCETCAGLGHQESSLRCALEEALFLNRTFVMPSGMCINPTHNKKGILDRSDDKATEEGFVECKDRGNRSNVMLPYSFLPNMAAPSLRNAAEKIKAQLGDYDAIHVRRGDKLKTRKDRFGVERIQFPHLDRDTRPEFILRRIENKIPRGRTLFIGSNERTPGFFSPLAVRYKLAYSSNFSEILDPIIKNNYQLFMVERLVMMGAKTFFKTFKEYETDLTLTDDPKKNKNWEIPVYTMEDERKESLMNLARATLKRIVMVSLLRKLVPQSEYRKLLGAVVVIAANAGGAWTPIGDVSTTMLWIHGLGVLWVLTDAIHYGESERQKLKIPQALSFTSIE
uniref:O-fucosyltransferase family protein n=1 Tax=Brassica campestris TaxID=3711 RepID=M4CGB7_BRACM